MGVGTGGPLSGIVATAPPAGVRVEIKCCEGPRCGRNFTRAVGSGRRWCPPCLRAFALAYERNRREHALALKENAGAEFQAACRAGHRARSLHLVRAARVLPS